MYVYIYIYIYIHPYIKAMRCCKRNAVDLRGSLATLWPWSAVVITHYGLITISSNN